MMGGKYQQEIEMRSEIKDVLKDRLKILGFIPEWHSKKIKNKKCIVEYKGSEPRQDKLLGEEMKEKYPDVYLKLPEYTRCVKRIRENVFGVTKQKDENNNYVYHPEAKNFKISENEQPQGSATVQNVADFKPVWHEAQRQIDMERIRKQDRNHQVMMDLKGIMVRFIENMYSPIEAKKILRGKSDV